MIHVAFDADVIIFAAAARHPLGARVIPVLRDADVIRTGSVILLPEVLSKARREHDPDLESLEDALGLIELLPFDLITARAAVDLAARYRLRAADATHLATAVIAGADTFITNNRKDFLKSIAEIDVVYPDELPAA